jgi:hypothetical protein
VDPQSAPARGLRRERIGLATLGLVAEKPREAQKVSVAAADVEEAGPRSGRWGEMTHEIANTSSPTRARKTASEEARPCRSEPVSKSLVEQPPCPFFLEVTKRPVTGEPHRSNGRGVRLIANVGAADTLARRSWVEPDQPAGAARPERPGTRHGVETIFQTRVKQRSLPAPAERTGRPRLDRSRLPPLDRAYDGVRPVRCATAALLRFHGASVYARPRRLTGVSEKSKPPGTRLPRNRIL